MNKLTICGLMVLASMGAVAQKKPVAPKAPKAPVAPAPVVESDETLMLRYAQTITKEDLKKHLSILASDAYEGRETGMKGQRMAAEYIENDFKSNGLQAVVSGGYQQSFPIIIEKAGNSTLSANGKNFEFIKDFFYVGSFKEGVVSSNDIVFLGYGVDSESYSDYKAFESKGGSVKGKIVAYFEGQPKDKNGVDLVTGDNNLAWTNDRTKKSKLAAEKGASGVLVITADYDKKVAQFKSFILNPRIRLKKPSADGDKKAGIPVFYVSERVADDIMKSGKTTSADLKESISKKKKALNAVAATEVKMDIKKDIVEGASSNVLGFVEGSDLKEQIVVISAHYDHIGMSGDKIFNGADDDGSGTVSVLELSQAFAKAKADGHGPRRSMLFLTVSGEEKGLLGSEWYTDNPILPLANTVTDLNIDMVGRQDKKYENNPNYVYVIGSDKLSSDLHKISEEANTKYAKLTLDYTYNAPNDPNRFYYRSDHYNFAKHDIPVIFYFNGTHPDYHQETDEVEKINFDKMEKIDRLIFYTAWEVANRNERLKVDTKSDMKN